jgi:hypothetical protein
VTSNKQWCQLAQFELTTTTRQLSKIADASSYFLSTTATIQLFEQTHLPGP